MTRPHLTCTATRGEQSSSIDVSSKPGSTGQGSIDDFLINCTMLSKSQLRMAVVRPSSGQSIMTAEAGGPPASGAAATDKGLLEFGYR